jgi:hypothetical protein
MGRNGGIPASSDAVTGLFITVCPLIATAMAMSFLA